jgi:hypothetical protein
VATVTIVREVTTAMSGDDIVPIIREALGIPDHAEHEFIHTDGTIILRFKISEEIEHGEDR